MKSALAVFERDVGLVTDRSLAKVSDRTIYTARCGGYFGLEPGYVVLFDVRDARGALIADEINGDVWEGLSAQAGDPVAFAARLVDWRDYADNLAPFTFEDMRSPQ
jgi:hypothetical protein